MTTQHTIAFVEPGHFHAAPTLKTPNARVNDDVHVYATPGPERDAFVSLIEAFNARGENPTNWRLHLHDTSSPVEQLVADGFASFAVLAGKNAKKLSTIAALHRAGIPVLADKPWLTRSDARADLHQVTSGLPLAHDIMTERYDIRARLRRAVVATPSVFGELDASEPNTPAIEIGSKHHLYKMVNGVPLIRPAWYYNVGVQGDGLVDIQSHMTDQMQWLIGETLAEGPYFDFAKDVTALDAKRWGTPVSIELFEKSTGMAAFPEDVTSRVTQGVLDLQCNSEIRYQLRGVPVLQRAEWGQEEPPGSGDIHSVRIRGTRAEIVLEHGEHTGYEMQLHLKARGDSDLQRAVRDALPQWQQSFSGLAVTESDHGVRFLIPDELATTHEQHFAMCLDAFMNHLESGKAQPRTAARIRMRYEVLAAAKEQVDG